MFIVKRCVQDFDAVCRTEVAEFETEREADDFAAAEDASHPWGDVWYEVQALQCFDAVFRFCFDSDIRGGREDLPQAAADEFVVVGDQHAQGRAQ